MITKIDNIYLISTMWGRMFIIGSDDINYPKHEIPDIDKFIIMDKIIFECKSMNINIKALSIDCDTKNTEITCDREISVDETDFMISCINKNLG